MRKSILFLIIIAHVSILSLIKFFPYPEIFIYPYLVRKGLLPYKDIFDQHFPSLLFSPVNFASLGVNSEVSARFFNLLLIVMNHILLFSSANFILKRQRKKALIANILYLLIQPLFEGNFFWLGSLASFFVLLSFYLLLKLRSEREVSLSFLVFLGLILGMLLFIKQSMLPFFAIFLVFVFLELKSLRNFLILFFSSLLPFSLSLLWIFNKNIFSDFFYWSVIFNLEIYAEMARKLPNTSQLIRFTLFWMTIIIFCFVKRREKYFPEFFSLLSASFFLILPRFEFVHLQPTIPILLLAFEKIRVKFANFAKILSFLWILVLVIWWPRFLSKNFLKESPTFDSVYFEISRRIQSLPGEKNQIFVFGTSPIIYVITNTIPPTPFSLFLPWNLSAKEESILNGLKINMPSIVVRDIEASVDGKKVIEFSSRINRFVEENYKVVEEVGSNQILLLK